MKIVIGRIHGGLGNQLFCYAAARALALRTNSRLLLDVTSGFLHDYQYRRQYSLQNFHIDATHLSSLASALIGGRFTRKVWIKLLSQRAKPKRNYLLQEGVDFDPDILSLQPSPVLYLDGYWQSENYFKDYETQIRRDLTIQAPQDANNQRISGQIKQVESVSLHVRWFDTKSTQSTHNITLDYYQNAIAHVTTKVKNPHFFLFSDDPAAAQDALGLPSGICTVVNINQGDSNAYKDLWLMSQCQHHITANSTFSWWGAWLNSNPEKHVFTPDIYLEGKTAWGFPGLIPPTWIKVAI